MNGWRWRAIVVLLGLSLSAMTPLSDWIDRVEQAAYQSQIDQSLRLCYALEGFYPPNFAYLVEHYGVVEHERYLVRYKAFASNLRPEVSLYRIGARR